MRYPERGGIPLQYHHTMLVDRQRGEAFRRAIQRGVRPGDVVLDVGAGTGLLSYFAASRARTVYAIEADPGVARVGRELIRRNGLAEKVQYWQGRAEELVPPEPIDVIICEMLHVGLAEEQQVPVLNAVRGRLGELFPGHPFRVIPQEAVSYCQLVEASFEYFGYEAPFVRLGDTYIPDPSIVGRSDLSPYFHADFSGPVQSNVSAVRHVAATSAGTVTAIRLLTQAVLWFDELADPADRLIDWYLNYLIIPLDDPIPVEVGRVVDVVIDYAAGAPLGQVQVLASAK